MNFEMIDKIFLIFLSPVALVALIIRSNMNFDMFYKILLMFVSLAALAAPEWSRPSVRLHVLLQIARRSTSVVALVTFERLLSCVHPHHMNFQTTRSSARIIA